MGSNRINDIERLAIIEYKKELEEYFGDNLRKMILYGSKARGDASAESDIDILLILSTMLDRIRTIRLLSDLESKMNLKYGVLISSYPVEEKYYFQNSEIPFVKEIKRYGIVI